MNFYKPPRNVLILGLTSFFNDLSSEMILAVFPAFFVSVLKTGASSLGLVEGLASGASNLIKIYAGRLSDRLASRKPFIILGYSLSVIIRPAYLLAESLLPVLILRFLDRVGKGLREGPRDAIISLSTKKEELGRAFGYHRAMDTLGAIIGPLIAYLILRQYPSGFHVVFMTAFIVGIFAVLSTFFIKDVIADLSRKNITLGIIGDYPPALKRYLFALFLLSVGSIPVAVLLLATQHIESLTLASIPLFYMLYNVSYAAFSYISGKLSDKHGAKDIILLGYIILLIGYAVLMYAKSTPILIVAFLILGLFPALTDGVQRALASTLSPEETRSGAFGLVNATSGFGLLFAGLVGGYLWEHAGSVTALVVSGVFILIGMLILQTVPAKDPT